MSLDDRELSRLAAIERQLEAEQPALARALRRQRPRRWVEPVPVLLAVLVFVAASVWLGAGARDWIPVVLALPFALAACAGLAWQDRRR